MLSISLLHLLYTALTLLQNNRMFSCKKQEEERKKERKTITKGSKREEKQ